MDLSWLLIFCTLSCLSSVLQAPFVPLPDPYVPCISSGSVTSLLSTKILRTFYLHETVFSPFPYHTITSHFQLPAMFSSTHQIPLSLSEHILSHQFDLVLFICKMHTKGLFLCLRLAYPTPLPTTFLSHYLAVLSSTNCILNPRYGYVGNRSQSLIILYTGLPSLVPIISS